MNQINGLYFFLMFHGMFLFGCMGPTSPFGSIELGSGDGNAFQSPTTVIEVQDDLKLFPRRQVLHEARDLEILVRGSDVEQAIKSNNLRVDYNGKNVTEVFKKYLHVNSSQEHELRLVYENLRLTPNLKHKIEFFVSIDNGKSFLSKKYLPPQCEIFKESDVQSTLPFKIDSSILVTIKENAEKYKINPNLLAGLIAQESGFDPNATSRAGAKGLTQITNLAAQEIENTMPSWTGLRTEDSHTDWRNNPEKSVEGGAIYLKYLIKYWSENSAEKILSKANIKDTAPIILASYNSGAARVKRNVSEFGLKWLDQRNLTEAFRYVNNVSSYCYHFGEASP